MDQDPRFLREGGTLAPGATAPGVAITIKLRTWHLPRFWVDVYLWLLAVAVLVRAVYRGLLVAGLALSVVLGPVLGHVCDWFARLFNLESHRHLDQFPGSQLPSGIQFWRFLTTTDHVDGDFVDNILYALAVLPVCAYLYLTIKNWHTRGRLEQAIRHANEPAELAVQNFTNPAIPHTDRQLSETSAAISVAASVQRTDPQYPASLVDVSALQWYVLLECTVVALCLLLPGMADLRFGSLGAPVAYLAISCGGGLVRGISILLHEGKIVYLGGQSAYRKTVSEGTSMLPRRQHPIPVKSTVRAESCDSSTNGGNSGKSSKVAEPNSRPVSVSQNNTSSEVGGASKVHDQKPPLEHPAIPDVTPESADSIREFVSAIIHDVTDKRNVSWQHLQPNQVQMLVDLGVDRLLEYPRNRVSKAVGLTGDRLTDSERLVEQPESHQKTRAKRQRLRTKVYISYLGKVDDKLDENLRARYGLLDKEEWSQARLEQKADFMLNTLPLLFDQVRRLDASMETADPERLRALGDIKESILADIIDLEREAMPAYMEEMYNKVVYDPRNEPYLDEHIKFGPGGLLERGESSVVPANVLDLYNKSAGSMPLNYSDFSEKDWVALAKIKALYPGFDLRGLPSTFDKREELYLKMLEEHPEADIGQPQISDETEANKIAQVRDSIGRCQGQAFLYNFSNGTYFLTCGHVLKAGRILDYKGKKYPNVVWEVLPHTDYARCRVPSGVELKGIKAWGAYQGPLHYLDFAELHMIKEDGTAGHSPGWLLADLDNHKYPQRMHSCGSHGGFSGAPLLTTTGFGEAQVVWVLGIHQGSIAMTGLMTPMTTINKISNLSGWVPLGTDLSLIAESVRIPHNWEPAPHNPSVAEISAAVQEGVTSALALVKESASAEALCSALLDTVKPHAVAESSDPIALSAQAQLTEEDVKKVVKQNRKERAGMVETKPVKATEFPKPEPKPDLKQKGPAGPTSLVKEDSVGKSAALHNELRRMYNLLKMFAEKVGPLTQAEEACIRSAVARILEISPNYDWTDARKIERLKGFIPAPSVSVPK